MMRNKETTILIIDDDESIRLLLEQMIKHHTGCSVITVDNGLNGIELAHARNPDLILLDIVMPTMDGYAVAGQLKQDARTASIPIMFITGLNDIEDKVKAFKHGAIDYIVKPFNQEEVLARINAQIQLQRQFNHIQALNKLIHFELDLARKIQGTILTDRTVTTDNLSIICRYLPLETIGGDFYDIIQVAKNRFIVVVSDITGHGIPAALYSMTLKIHIGYLTKSLHTPAALMTGLNRDLIDLLYEQYYPTALIVMLDLDSMVLTYANAGHIPPIHYNASSNTAALLTDGDFNLGIEAGKTYSETRVSLNKGDRIILCTDGLLDRKEISTVSLNNIMEVLRNNRTSALADNIRSIVDHSLAASCVPGRYTDDVVVIGIQINPSR